MKKIIAINASPRTVWNTATLVREAARGAEGEGAEVMVYDLYQLEAFQGCVSCFGCKLPQNLAKCIRKDGLTAILEEIRTADGLILGSPNYLGNATAAFRALYERLVFPYITYKIEPKSYSERKIPVLLIMTSNVGSDSYDKIGYDALLENYQKTFNQHIGPTQIIKCGNTLQVNDYSIYGWDMFSEAERKERRATIFPQEKQNAFALGAKMVQNPWKE